MSKALFFVTYVVYFDTAANTPSDQPPQMAQGNFHIELDQDDIEEQTFTDLEKSKGKEAAKRYPNIRGLMFTNINRLR
jgi:hypothetical protein